MPETPIVRRDIEAGEAFYATRPTRGTLFLRTFIPWQLWRFAVINLKMLRIIGRSHRGGR